MRLVLLTLVALSGCDLDMNFDFDSKSITVASSPGTLHITGCATSGILGCGGGAPGVEMSVGLDGVWKLVPVYQPAPFELFPDRQFDIVVPPPVDDYVGVWLAGRVTQIEQLPWFDIEWPATVRRGDGAVPFRFLAYPDAEVAATVTSQCPNTPQVQTELGSLIVDGAFSVRVDDPAFEGTCTHEVRVTQTLVDYGRTIAIIDVSRTEVATFTSTN